MSDEKKNVYQFEYEGKDILLIGTAHVSRESVALVKETIEAEKPDTVCVELCESRFQALRQKDRWENMDIIKVIKEKKAFLLLSNLILSAFQRKIADKLDMKPGMEMQEAIDQADALEAHIHLADRDIRTTLSRTWRVIGLWSKFKLISELVLSLGSVDDITEEDIEKMKEQDILESLLQEMEKSFPQIRTTVIDERDQYLAHSIRTAPGKKIVAVVGAGHVPGIKKYWDQPIDIERLKTLPPKGNAGNIFKWGLPGMIILLFIAGFFYAGPAAGTNMLIYWVLANGIFAGLGALIALGHPLTILSAFVAAPLTSLNPMIAAGWVSGLVEAFSRKPKVRDFNNLSDDILSVRGFWRNKITRILLVVVFTNLGSAAGTFIAIPLMAKFLGT